MFNGWAKQIDGLFKAAYAAEVLYDVYHNRNESFVSSGVQLFGDVDQGLSALTTPSKQLQDAVA
eukprot:3432580-Alexandrium_andersonii.AAC.1